jgi:V/A-type H+-transporting ATPase subunit E
MGLDEVVGDIEDAGRARAGATMKEADEEKGKLLSDAKEKARQMMDVALREAERQAAQIRVREMSGAELEVKRARLVMERDLLTAASEGASKKVAALPRSQDEGLLLAILGKNGVPGYRMFSAAKNEAFLRTRLEFTYAGNIDCLGGVLFESPDGSVRMDFTYDTILREVVERTMRDIYEIIFPR